MNCVGHISGGAFNPAIAIAVAVANRGDFRYALLVSVADLIGAILATVLFYVTTPAELKPLPWKWVRKPDRAVTLTQRYRTESLIIIRRCLFEKVENGFFSPTVLSVSRSSEVVDVWWKFRIFPSQPPHLFNNIESDLSMVYPNFLSTDFSY